MDERGKPRPGRCNFPLDGGARFCSAPAGARTAHVGTGYCQPHDSRDYDPIHRYRGLKQKSLSAKMQRLDAVERNVFDLVPEIQLLRGLMLDYVERFYEFQDALIAWHADVGKKPKFAMDITEVTGMIEGISRLIERHSRIESKDAISLETFRRATEMMGIIVAKHVRQGSVLDAIEADWKMINLDSKNDIVGVPLAETTAKAITDGEES
jgi:hypothetical protein